MRDTLQAVPGLDVLLDPERTLGDSRKSAISDRRARLTTKRMHASPRTPSGGLARLLSQRGLRQLLSLSFSLGAFAAFFLVAAQCADDREAFVQGTLVRYRRALLVYTIYCRAHDLAKDWTHVPIELKLCRKETG